MESQQPVLYLQRALKDLLERSGMPLSRVSKKIGRYPAYLSRALAGQYDLKVEDTFRVLATLKVDPKEFLSLVFPFGGDGARSLLVKPPHGYEPDPRQQELLSAERSRRGELHLAPSQRTDRVRQLLKTLLRRKKVSQRRASVAQGLGGSALGQALRGGAKLTWVHVFGILASCQISAGRFIMELFGPGDEDLLAGLRWTWLLDEMEAKYQILMADAAERVKEQHRRARAS